MSTRLSDAERARDQIIAQIASGAKVYKGGGTELFNLTPAEKGSRWRDRRIGSTFPRFGEADHKGGRASSTAPVMGMTHLCAPLISTGQRSSTPFAAKS